MMALMVADRHGRVCAMDDRYCIDNGAMIAYTGLLAEPFGLTEEVSQTTVRQRYRTDEVWIPWRGGESGIAGSEEVQPDVDENNEEDDET